MVALLLGWLACGVQRAVREAGAGGELAACVLAALERAFPAAAAVVGSQGSTTSRTMARLPGGSPQGAAWRQARPWASPAHAAAQSRPSSQHPAAQLPTRRPTRPPPGRPSAPPRWRSLSPRATACCGSMCRRSDQLLLERAAAALRRPHCCTPRPRLASLCMLGLHSVLRPPAGGCPPRWLVSPLHTFSMFNPPLLRPPT